MFGLHRASAQSYQGLEALKLIDVVDGDSISLDHKTSGQLVVVIFTSNSCPYSVKYEDRIKELYNSFSKGDIQLFLVNPNKGPDDTLERMKAKANTLGYKFPYLKDHDQVLTEILGATRTPEAYLLKPVANGYELIYSGAIDDTPQTGDDVKNDYLRTAIEKALKGDSVASSEVRVTGCVIIN
jgi:peroxiredoxin